MFSTLNYSYHTTHIQFYPRSWDITYPIHIQDSGTLIELLSQILGHHFSDSSLRSWGITFPILIPDPETSLVLFLCKILEHHLSYSYLSRGTSLVLFLFQILAHHLSYCYRISWDITYPILIPDSGNTLILFSSQILGHHLSHFYP